ncbi:MAG: hypothetical protein OEY89_13885 [Gammaproteobacteria bacterium]|nr:hypothetical protein [Gammaproteobacteria bacterium]
MNKKLITGSIALFMSIASNASVIAIDVTEIVWNGSIGYSSGVDTLDTDNLGTIVRGDTD